MNDRIGFLFLFLHPTDLLQWLWYDNIDSLAIVDQDILKHYNMTFEDCVLMDTVSILYTCNRGLMFNTDEETIACLHRSEFLIP